MRSKPGLTSSNPLCPVKLPQSRAVVKATGRRKGEKCLQGCVSVDIKASTVWDRNRINHLPNVKEPKRIERLVQCGIGRSPGRRGFHLLSSELRWWM
ncbi:Hypothetical predicted protein [Xyrichtys novacula]|uniref:Uncharacterized protein n=1 Tax=Xyrichtys novacula TaxID=13765 RepID=A0AAV1EZL8_XYRNO|nr:Hypothetical predicted protein [Xyrichtys novacula]